MAELSFAVEWEAGDSVSHPALAATWARLEVRVGEQYVTSLYDRRDKSTRTGTYGSVFPLCEWLVNNFWFLLRESSPPGKLPAEWLRRHSLVAGREGGSLPDLRLFRDEDEIIAEWHSTRAPQLPVDFVTSGRVGLDPNTVRAQVTQLIDSVLERLRSVNHPDVQALKADWEAIVALTGSDAELGARAARMGLDAFDEDEVPDSLANTLMDSLNDIPEATGGDLLDAGMSKDSLDSTLRVISEIVAPTQGKKIVGGGIPKWDLPVSRSAAAYEQGYAMARALRAKTGQAVNGRVNLDSLTEQLGYGEMLQGATWGGTDPAVKAVVGVADGKPTLVARRRADRAARFLLARGLYTFVSRATEAAPRLVTSGGTRLQAASRAFAAELLAPIEALRTRVGRFADEERLEELADEFDVSPVVIERQLENDHAGRHMAFE